MNHRAPRLAARVTEALGLSLLVGVLAAAIDLATGKLPILTPAVLGFLCGGIATMRTFGLQIVDPRWRMSLAALGAVLALGVGYAGDYASFLHDQRASHLAVDYRLPPTTVDGRIEASLQAVAGRGGFVGYQLATIKLGATAGPWRLAGLPLVLLRLIDIVVAIGIASRWARGPAATTAEPSPG